MTRKTISTMMIFASCTCLGFADQGETEVPEEKCCAITEGESSGDEVPTLPPVLEKCKKKKR